MTCIAYFRQQTVLCKYHLRHQRSLNLHDVCFREPEIPAQATATEDVDTVSLLMTLQQDGFAHDVVNVTMAKSLCVAQFMEIPDLEGEEDMSRQVAAAPAVRSVSVTDIAELESEDLLWLPAVAKDHAVDLSLLTGCLCPADEVYTLCCHGLICAWILTKVPCIKQAVHQLRHVLLPL